jgi:uncharacterized surface anchored protein
MARQLSIANDFEGSRSVDIGDFKVKLTGRMTRRVDEKMIIAIANEKGLVNHLDSLFRWKADINTAMWNKTNPEITAEFLRGITTKPGRVGFSIEKVQEKTYAAAASNSIHTIAARSVTARRYRRNLPWHI